MMRKGDVLLLILAIAFSFSFFVPLAPVDFGKTWAPICPQGPFVLCGTSGGMLFHGQGSLTYQVFGVGGAWYYDKYEILHNGCYVANNGVTLLCTHWWKPGPNSP